MKSSDGGFQIQVFPDPASVPYFFVVINDCENHTKRYVKQMSNF
jgi:hypothetical protein